MFIGFHSAVSTLPTASLPMSALRLSAIFLAVAALAGGAGIGLPELWSGTLRALCLGALVAFVVSFLVGLDKSSLVRR